MMNKRILTTAMAVALAVCFVPAPDAGARDTPDTLRKVDPKDKSGVKSGAERQAPRQATPPKTREAKPDTFIDRDSNGIDDRHERKVVRPDAKNAPAPAESKPPAPPAKRGDPPRGQKPY